MTETSVDNIETDENSDMNRLLQVSTDSVLGRNSEVTKKKTSHTKKKSGAERSVPNPQLVLTQSPTFSSSSSSSASNGNDRFVSNLVIPDISGGLEVVSASSVTSPTKGATGGTLPPFSRERVPHFPLKNKRPRTDYDDPEEGTREEITGLRALQSPQHHVRDNLDEECDNDSDELLEDEDDDDMDDIMSPLRFPGMLANEDLFECELNVKRDLKRMTAKYLKNPWKDIDILNEIMDPKLRRRFEVGALSSRTFYPAPKTFVKPLRGRTANAFRDTAWYRLQSDINIMYRYLMYSIAQMQDGNTESAYSVLMTVVIPFVYHMLSCCNRERMNVRYPTGVVSALYDDDTEPFVRPELLKRAKRLAAERKDMETLSDSFFGRGDRKRGSFSRSRRNSSGPRRRERNFSRFPPRPRYRQKQRKEQFNQQRTQQFRKDAKKN